MNKLIRLALVALMIQTAYATKEVIYQTPNLPFAAKQIWRGHYMCAQGKTKLDLIIKKVSQTKIKSELGPAFGIEAVFDFSFEGTHTAAGSFKLSGKYYADKRMAVFEPGPWIKQPKGYYSVGLAGMINQKTHTYEGLITTQGCQEFKLRRNQ